MTEQTEKEILRNPIITAHAILRARQRFNIKSKTKAKFTLKEGLKNGTLIEHENKFNFSLKHKDMYLMVQDGMLKTVFTEEQFKNKT